MRQTFAIGIGERARSLYKFGNFVTDSEGNMFK